MTYTHTHTHTHTYTHMHTHQIAQYKGLISDREKEQRSPQIQQHNKYKVLTRIKDQVGGPV